MKTKLIFTAVIYFLMITSASFAQKTIAVQNNGTASFYADWLTAWQNTQVGDTIYLPGGPYTTGNIDINKKVTIIGVGHDTAYIYNHMFSHLNGTIRLLKGADGTALHGFQFGNLQIGTSSSNDSLGNINISRCRCTGSVTLGFNNPSKANNVTFDECVLNEIDGQAAKNANFYKNIITGSVQDFDGSASFVNNVFTRTDIPLFQYVKSTLFRNNIFRYAGYPVYSNRGENNLFENNIFAGNLVINTSTDLNIWTDNFFNQPIEGVIENYTVIGYSSANDYHLKSGSIGIGAGTDGFDIGIYGTAIPYKVGGVPFTPRIVQETVSKQTDNEGKININVKVEAQER